MEERSLPQGPKEITRLILTYLVDHPDAKDTVEGILTFWVKQHDVQAKEQVEMALDELVNHEWLIKRELTSDKKFYGINKQVLGDITSFLQTS